MRMNTVYILQKQVYGSHPETEETRLSKRQFLSILSVVAAVSDRSTSKTNDTEDKFQITSISPNVEEQFLPMFLDSSESHIFSIDFVPPPPQPIFLNTSAIHDDLTSCNLCAWMLHKSGFDTSSAVSTGTGWVLTLVVVSLTSAVIGAIITIVVLKCKRITTLVGNGPENIDDKNQITVTNQNATIAVNKKSIQSQEDCKSSVNLNNGIWPWQRRKTFSCSSLTTSSIQHVENHYIDIDNEYDSIDEEIYSELNHDNAKYVYDRGRDQSGQGRSLDEARVSLAPISDYYADLSTAVVQDKPYENIKMSNVSIRKNHIFKKENVGDNGGTSSDYV